MKLKILGLVLSTIFILASCNDGEVDGLKDHALVSFKLVDAPDSYDAILIDLVGLEYKIEVKEDTEGEDSETEGEETEDDDSEEESESGRIAHDHPEKDCDDEGEWITLDVEPQVIDILQLQNGAEALLAQTEIEAGDLKEVRLILGDNNKIVVDGDTLDLKVPSGASSGLKIKVHSDIEAGELYDVVIDFMACKSIVKKGNGEYILKPVIRAKLVHDDDPYGSISGIVTPQEGLSTFVHAINMDDDTLSTQPEEDGTYLIELLLPGTYTVVVEPNDESGFEDVTIEGVEVIEEETTEVETVTFE
ncbi:MAG: DUF4382 domain-containing protein [Bacteroidota bacterium]